MKTSLCSKLNDSEKNSFIILMRNLVFWIMKEHISWFLNFMSKPSEQYLKKKILIEIYWFNFHWLNISEYSIPVYQRVFWTFFIEDKINFNKFNTGVSCCKIINSFFKKCNTFILHWLKLFKLRTFYKKTFRNRS